MTRNLSKIKEELKIGINSEIFSDANKLEIAEWLLSDVNKTFAEAFHTSLERDSGPPCTDNASGVIAMKLARSISEIRLIKETLRKMIK